MRTKFARIVSTIFAFTIAICAFSFTGISGTVYAATTTAAQEARDKEGDNIVSNDVDFFNDFNIDQSFAYAVRMATNYADRQYSVGNPIGGLKEDASYSSYLDISNIAPFYGYSIGEIENDQLHSQQKTRTSNSDSKSMVTYSKSLLQKYNGYNDKSSPAYGYYSYGLLLSMMGFDSVGTDASDVTRTAYGSIAQLAYYAASSVNMIFETCFDFLWATNPFLFFKDIATTPSGSAVLQGINGTATSAMNGDTTAVNELTSYFGNIFNAFTSFAWTISIPLSLLFIIVSFFLSRRGRYMIGSNIKKFLIRVVFVAIGIPILGSAYTQVLDGLRHTQSTSDEFLSQAVSQTFVDFRRWTETSRLTPPSELGVVVSDRDNSDNVLVKGNVIINLRKLCSDVNRQSGLFSFSGSGGMTTSAKTGVLLKDYIYDTSGANLTINSGKTGSTTELNYDNRQAVNDILKDYKDGIKYTATMFENGAIAWMQQRGSGSSGTSYGDMLALSCDKYSFSQRATRKISGLQGNVDAGAIQYSASDSSKRSTYGDVALNRFKSTDNFANIGYNIWNNGALSMARRNGDGTNLGDVADEAQGDIKHTMVGLSFTSGGEVGEGNTGYDCSQPIGLSTMSMYTYLTSEFTQAGILVYGNSSSSYTHKYHYAVNLIGCNSIMQFAFLANTISILLGYFFLAVAYVFRTIFDILFKGFQIMGHSLLAAAGFYKSIGTCICMVINMIAQVFITVVFFSFMVDFMFMLTSIFDNFFFSVFNAVTNGIGNKAVDASAYTHVTSYGAEVITTISALLSTFVTVFFVSFATKWRALIMNAINNMTESVVGTCLGVQLSGASDGALGGMMKSALNDAKNVAKIAATVGGGVALVDGAQDMLRDLSNPDNGSESDDGGEGESAFDAAANPTTGSSLAGKGAQDNDPDAKKEGNEVLEKGLGGALAAQGQTNITPEDEAAMANMTNEEKQEYLRNKAEQTSNAFSSSSSDHTDATNTNAGAGSVSANGETVQLTPEDEAAMANMTDEEKQEYLRNKVENASVAAQNDSNIADNSYLDNMPEPTEKDLEAMQHMNPTEQQAYMRQMAQNATKDKKVLENMSPEERAEFEAMSPDEQKQYLADKRNDVRLDDYKSLQGETAASSSADGAEREKVFGGYYYGGTAAQQEAQRKLDENISAGGSDDVLTRSGFSYDAKRGLVMTSNNADGTSSDVAFGASGLSFASTDAAGTITTQTIGTNGTVNLTRVGTDGSSETYSATASGETSSQVIETLADGSKQTTIVDTSGVKTITTENAATGEQTIKRINVNGTYTVEGHANGRDVSYSGSEQGYVDLMLNDTAIRQEIDTDNNVVTQSFTTGANSYRVVKASTGSTVINTVAGGANCEYINNLDGSGVYTTRIGDNSRREILTVQNGSVASKVEYRNSSGETITDSAVIRKLDESYNKSWENIETDVSSIYNENRIDIQNVGIQDIGDGTLKRKSGDKVSK